MTTAVPVAIAAAAALWSCGKKPPAQDPPGPPTLAELAPAHLPGPLPDSTNRFADDPRAAALGKRLFVDPGFSGALIDGDNDGSANALGVRGQTGKISCAGCHVPAAGFLDDRSLGKQISLAAGWNLRRTPSLLDVGQSKVLHWDGRRDAIWNQIFGPLEHASEMNSSRLFAAEQIFQRYRADYEAIFGPLPPLDDAARFPPLDAAHTGCTIRPGGEQQCHGVPGDAAEYAGMRAADQEAVTRVMVNFGKAIEAYLRTLSCGPSRFDDWAHGNSAALDASEQRGAALFLGKASCATCHRGAFLSDEKFHNVGLYPQTVAAVFIDANDPGALVGLRQALADPLNTRGKFSDGDDGRLPADVGSEMEGAFRTPKLRCVSARPSFMHTGQLMTLEQVVDFFDRGGYPMGYPGVNELKPLGLSAQEKSDLVAFMKSLGELH